MVVAFVIFDFACGSSGRCYCTRLCATSPVARLTQVLCLESRVESADCVPFCAFRQWTQQVRDRFTADVVKRTLEKVDVLFPMHAIKSH